MISKRAPIASNSVFNRTKKSNKKRSYDGSNRPIPALQNIINGVPGLTVNTTTKTMVSSNHGTTLTELKINEPFFTPAVIDDMDSFSFWGNRHGGKIDLWNQAAHASLKWKKLTDFDHQSIPDHVGKHVLSFGSDVSSDYYAEALSPRYSDLLPINIPVANRNYPSPVHYVEAMKILSVSTPKELLGLVPPTPCDYARDQIDLLVNQPNSYIIEDVAGRCDGDRTGDFYDVSTVAGKFYISLWIALWAKYKINRKYLNTLLGTGRRMLVYHSSEEFYGINKEMKGGNCVGFMLMLLRAMPDQILSGKVSPVVIYDLYVRPILDNIVNYDPVIETVEVIEEIVEEEEEKPAKGGIFSLFRRKAK